MAKAKTDALTAQRPERLIMLVSGPSGAGKSFFCACVPNALIYDTDVGGGLAAYDARIARNNSVRIEVSSYPQVIQDMKDRGKKLADYSTVIVDHLSVLQAEATARYNPSGEKDFGAAGEKAAREWRRLRDMVRRFDFNLICCSHLKGKFERTGGKFEQVGVQADASKNIEGDFMIHLHLQETQQPPSQARRVKWRRDPDDSRGKVPDFFNFTMETVLTIHGWPLDYDRAEVEMASTQDMWKLEGLIDTVKLPEGTTEKWLAAANASEWSELTADQIKKAIAHCEKLIEDATNKAKSGK